MDNGTHTLCGLVLARVGGERLGPLATPTLVVAANFPDSDIVGALWGGRPFYLCHHRGLTHALVGLAVEAVLLGLFMAWLGRRLLPSDARPRAGRLMAAAALGLLSHLALDGLNTYGVRPWLPFDGTWYYGDTAFIADPWMWLIFGAAACLGAPRPRPAPAPADEGQEAAPGPRPWGWRASTTAWWTATCLVVLLILTNERGVPPAVALLWGPLMATAVLARGRLDDPARPRRRHLVVAAVALLALPYLGAMRALNEVALERARGWAREQGHPPVEGGVCHPTPVLPWRFHALVVTGGWIHDVDIDLRSGATSLRTSVERNLDDPALGDPAVTRTPEYEAWRTFARLPFAARAQVDARGPGLILGDARYAPRPEPAWCNLVVPLPD